ncbi:hypothetical protein K488DRAFT_35314, partial [Vararia minispora EC-137]
PIVQLLPPIRYVFSACASLTRTLWSYTTATVGFSLAPISLFILPLLGFVFAPLIVSFSLLFETFLIPYQLTIYVAQTMYPFYVIVGTAIICGAIVGLFARQSISLVGEAIL